MFKDPYDCRRCRDIDKLCALHAKIKRLHSPLGCEYCILSDELKCATHKKLGRVYG